VRADSSFFAALTSLLAQMGEQTRIIGRTGVNMLPHCAHGLGLGWVFTATHLALACFFVRPTVLRLCARLFYLSFLDAARHLLPTVIHPQF
jgi:hypothetical protein